MCTNRQTREQNMSLRRNGINTPIKIRKLEAQILQLAFIMIRNLVKLSRPRIDCSVEQEHSNVFSDAAKLGLAMCKQVGFYLLPSDLVVG